MNKLDEYQETHKYIKKLEIMQRWMNGDLKRSTTLGKANLLVAMGRFNDIEILGGFYEFHSQQRAF